MARLTQRLAQNEAALWEPTTESDCAGGGGPTANAATTCQLAACRAELQQWQSNGRVLLERTAAAVASVEQTALTSSLQTETSLLGSATRSLAAAAGATGQDAAAAAAAGQAAPAAKRRRRSSGSSGGSGGVAPERTHEEDALGESLQRAKAAAEAARAKGSPVEAAEERCETQKATKNPRPFWEYFLNVCQDRLGTHTQGKPAPKMTTLMLFVFVFVVVLFFVFVVFVYAGCASSRR